MDIQSLRNKLEKEKYIFDENLLVSLFISLKLQKPLLIEGVAGVGKTEIAKALASAFECELIRLQCYEGLDEAKSLYEWNYQKQLLSIQLGLNKNKGTTPELFSEEFLLERPLLKSIRSEKSNVLLIDEIDKTDEEFEAFLLELLSDFQLSIPELGTIKAINKPIVILTSNNTRQLSDALKRRCAYIYIDYPSVEKETKIILSRIPEAGEKLAQEVAKAIKYIRELDKISKKPSISEALDWVMALIALGKTKLDEEGANKCLSFILKNREDLIEFENLGGFSEYFSTGPN